jgi:hypothetical protein
VEEGIHKNHLKPELARSSLEPCNARVRGLAAGRGFARIRIAPTERPEVRCDGFEWSQHNPVGRLSRRLMSGSSRAQLGSCVRENQDQPVVGTQGVRDEVSRAG